MTELTVHEGGKHCNCIFCLTKCPECCASLDEFSCSVSFDVGKSEDKIWMQGWIDTITGLQDPDFELECQESGTRLTKRHFVKLQMALFKLIGGNVQIRRHEDGEIEAERFLIKTRPNLKELKKKGGK